MPGSTDWGSPTSKGVESYTLRAASFAERFCLLVICKAKLLLLWTPYTPTSTQPQIHLCTLPKPKPNFRTSIVNDENPLAERTPKIRVYCLRFTIKVAIIIVFQLFNIRNYRLRGSTGTRNSDLCAGEATGRLHQRLLLCESVVLLTNTVYTIFGPSVSGHDSCLPAAIATPN